MTMDQDQLVRLLLRERARLTAYIWSIVHEPHLTEDVFQEVCLEASRVGRGAKRRPIGTAGRSSPAWWVVASLRNPPDLVSSGGSMTRPTPLCAQTVRGVFSRRGIDAQTR